VAGMIGPSWNKAGHLTRICPQLGGLHDFDMQSSGGPTARERPAVGYWLSDVAAGCLEVVDRAGRGTGRVDDPGISTPLMIERVRGEA